METKIGYKVVTDALKSIIMGYTNGLCVQYEIGIWAHAPDTELPLFVFKDIESARGYMLESCGSNDLLFACEYVRSENPLRKRLLTWDIEGVTIKKAKKMLAKHKYTTAHFHSGTDFAQSVKLLERVR